MRFLRRFFRSPASGRELDRVWFDDGAFTAAGDHEGVRVWHTPEGDGVGLYHFALPPDLPAGATTFRGFEASYRETAEASGARLVDLAIRTNRQGCKLVWSIVKIPQERTGMTYVGGITIPFRDFSYGVKIQCEEGPMTGTREAMLMVEALADGSVEFVENKITGEWNPDNARFDERFPDHPLSRLRRHLSSIEATLNVDDRISNEPGFALPG